MIIDCYKDTGRKILAHSNLHGKRTLEIGCGSGRVTTMYANDAWQVIGVEPEIEAVYKAAQAVPDASFICASGMNLPFAANSFDVVLFTLSLHHHPDCLAALDEAQRVIAQDGLIIVLEPTPESEIQRLCKVFEDEDYRLKTAEEALSQCGLEIASKETFITHWEFSEFEDVIDYTFSYYNHAPDAEKRLALQKFLGSKANDTPIQMTDSLRLTCLQSPQ